VSRLPVIGVLGGSFDPVHLGHLQLAGHIGDELRFDRILLVLAATPPHKAVTALSPAGGREAMLRLAVAEWPRLEVSRLELDREGIGYTIDSLRALRDGTPPCRPVFILGMDALADLPTWRDYRDLLREFDLVAVDRQSADLAHLEHSLDPAVAERLVAMDDSEAKRDLDVGAGGRVFHFPMEVIPISASEIRRLAAAGREVSHLVPPAVARYIQTTGIYRREENR